MTLGQNGRSATLTTLQKAGIYRKAMEEMRDHLEQVHVGYQRTDPDATYMIEGLVDIYEAMLRDFVVHGVPEDVGSPSHVKERFGSLTDEQRESLVEFFADDPEWRQRTRSKASGTLEDAGVVETEDNVDIARKVAFEGRLTAALEYRRRLADPSSMWSGFVGDHVIDVSAATPTKAATPTITAADTMPDVGEPSASMTPVHAAAQFIADNPKIMGDTRRKARWTDKTRSQFEAAARLLEKSYGAKPFRLLAREDVVRLNVHFSRLPASHHKPRRHDPMTLEDICLEAEAEVREKKREKTTIGLGPTTTNRHFQFLKELFEWFARQVPGIPPIP